jgi:hypothetical protein
MWLGIANSYWSRGLADADIAFRLFGLKVRLQENVAMGALFTIASSEGYALRRIFEAIGPDHPPGSGGRTGGRVQARHGACAIAPP